MSKQLPNELISTKEQSTDNQILQIEPLIRTIRGQQVLLDSDLAILYGVETKRLNEQVKRNIERFPEDFMFQLTKVELINLKSQIATSSEIDNSRSSQIVTLNTENHSLRSQICDLERGYKLEITNCDLKSWRRALSSLCLHRKRHCHAQSCSAFPNRYSSQYPYHACLHRHAPFHRF